MIDRRQVADVGRGIGELGLAEGPARPVGPLLLLRERDAEQLLDERGEPDLVADAEERGHQLGVDEARECRAEPLREQAEILARRVRDHGGVAGECRHHGPDVDGNCVEESHLRNDLLVGSI